MRPEDIAIGGYYHHKKSGGTYQVLMFATIEATGVTAVVYAARSGDGTVARWVRPLVEFCDGRFEAVDMARKDDSYLGGYERLMEQFFKDES